MDGALEKLPGATCDSRENRFGGRRVLGEIDQQMQLRRQISLVNAFDHAIGVEPVSYTHLTLPTIYSV